MWPFTLLLIIILLELLTSSAAGLVAAADPSYELSLTKSPYTVLLSSNKTTIVSCTLLSGTLNTTTVPITNTNTSTTSTDKTSIIAATMLTPTIAKITISNSTQPFTGARFSSSSSSSSSSAQLYGVWEYPWSNQIVNSNISFDLKGLASMPGTNYANARSPFFLSSAGYGVYTDTLSMGTYTFAANGTQQFVFNSSSLVYYIILPKTSTNTSDYYYKSILTQYGQLSSTVEMQATSGYGPTFWSDDFTVDLVPGATNARENVQDVVSNLYYNRIRASSMFLDRPYSTGYRAWGNFDFEESWYPGPKEFIANLSDYGLDLQLWIANRANEGTQLYAKAVSEGWLFPNVSPEQGQGPALNLSIPAAYSYFKSRLSNFTAHGIKGYKIDRGEEEEMPAYEQNLQMTLFSQLAYENMVDTWGAPTKRKPGKFYTFARSSVDRSRSRVGIWNGDTSSSFAGLTISIACAIRSGLIGFPIWGSDTGGFRRSSATLPTEELWARWMWFSAFSPVYEIMVGQSHYPWYEPYSSRLVDVLRQTTELHTQLLPFIESYVYRSTKDGLPLVRALFLETGVQVDDEQALVENGEYFFGQEFLVAPVRQAGGKKAVYFPKGVGRFLEYFNKTAVYDGGRTVSVTLDIDAVPAYVREGAIVPRGDIHRANNRWDQDWKPSLTVEVYPSFDVGSSQFEYYVEEKEASVLITMTTESEGGKVVVGYGDLGVAGQVVVFAKGGNTTVALKNGGGEVSLSGVVSLFA